MPDILERIVEQTRVDLRKRKSKAAVSDFRSFPLYEPDRRDFWGSLQDENAVSVIAEIKKASPSKGLIRDDFDVRRIAAQYREGGASAISVLTDEPFFKGELKNLELAYQEVDIPLLRKDFIVDPYQIEEARAHGADAILLIVRITDGEQLNELHDAATEAGLQCLVECYDEDDFNRIDFNRVKILGVNNRNLKTFEVELHRGVSLLNKAPGGVVTVSESGMGNTDDMRYLKEHGVNAALIGEFFMRKPHPGDALKELLEKSFEA